MARDHISEILDFESPLYPWSQEASKRTDKTCVKADEQRSIRCFACSDGSVTQDRVGKGLFICVVSLASLPAHDGVERLDGNLVNQTRKGFNLECPITHYKSENKVGHSAPYKSLQGFIRAQTNQLRFTEALACEIGECIVANNREQHENPPNGTEVVARHDSLCGLNDHDWL